LYKVRIVVPWTPHQGEDTSQEEGVQVRKQKNLAKLAAPLVSIHPSREGENTIRGKKTFGIEGLSA